MIKGIPIEEPEDFIVEEIIDKKFLRKFSRGKAVSRIEGPYTLCLLKKRMMTTHDAVDLIAKRFSIPASSIGYAGMKDKFAVTHQYITIKNFSGAGFESGNISLSIIGKTDKRISVGDLEANKFRITLHRWNKQFFSNIKKFSAMGFPNYFGTQRFGADGDNHKIGKLIVKRNFQDALSMMNSMYGKNFSDLNGFSKRRIKFLINAYQSWIFNCALGECLKKGMRPKMIKIPGSGTRLGKSDADLFVASILKKEGVAVSDFALPEVSLSCKGAERSAFVRTKITAEKISGRIRLSFVLTKGSYATVAVSEALK